ncbi:dihydroorotase [candidate division KSB1 bacterium]|nr:MAG: dihydroorotase [candidate division KSB1 bacterium]
MKPRQNSFLFKNGLIFNTANSQFEKGDILVVEGRIEKVGTIPSEDFVGSIIDLQEKYVAPGFVDMHVHLREPGREDEETIESGVAAAMAGGFTTVCCMPNTEPPIDNRGMVEFIKKKAKNLLVAVHPIGAVTKGRRGEELAEMGDMLDAGAVAFSDDGLPVASSELMRRALEYSKMFDIPIIDHCEDLSLSEGRSMNESFTSTQLGVYGIPAVAENIVVARDLMLAAYTGGHVHIAHVSTKDAVAMIREAKKRGVRVTCEVTPHHFVLTDEVVKSFDTNTKVNPPLRSQADVEAILQGLQDGTIDVIVSDHAPHSIEEKQVEFDVAPFGLIGMETSFGLIVKHLLEPKVLTPAQVIEKIVLNPARILKLGSKDLTPGNPADFTVFDMDSEWTVDVNRFKSKSRNCPFHGWQLRGMIHGVFNKGQWWSESLSSTKKI